MIEDFRVSQRTYYVALDANRVAHLKSKVVANF